ncbi:MAG: hypothetical protein WAU28_03860 [Candidatus Moraniibacteriota bacterium]
MQKIEKLITNILRGEDFILKLAEIVLTGLVLCGVVYFGVLAVGDFLHSDWSSMGTMYDFIATVLLILLGLEVARLILVHSIVVVMELMLLIIARKMLYPDISALEMIYCAIAFAIIVGVYYLYELKPLKSLEDLTK